MKNVINNERGIALVIAMFVMVLMTLLGVGAIYTSTLDVKISGNERTGLKAYYAAKAGIRDGERRLILNTADTRGYANYTGGASPDKENANWSKSITGTLPNGGSYSITITHIRQLNAITNAYDIVKDASNATPYYRITSEGVLGSSNRIVEKIIYLTFANQWNRAVTTCGALNIDSNSGTNSYNSAAGAYGGTNIGNSGDIYAAGTVSLNANTDLKGSITTTGNVAFDSNAKLIGNVTAGTSVTMNNNTNLVTGNVTASTTISNNGTITGNATAGSTITNSGTISGTISQNASVSPVPAPPECDISNRLTIPSNISTSNDNGTGISCSPANGCRIYGTTTSCATATPTNYCNVGNGTMTLTGSADAANPKKYYFKGLNVNSDSEIKTTGYVEIYVDGDYHQDANTIICSSGCGTLQSPGNPKPADILVYVYGNSNQNPGVASWAKIDSYSKLFGKLYAPSASYVNINSNTEIYGAVIGNNMSSTYSGGIDSNAGVHYDSQLSSSQNQTASGLVIDSYRECLYSKYTIALGEYTGGSCKPQ